MRFRLCWLLFVLFFFTDPATTEIYTLSLHDALPISSRIWKSWRSKPRGTSFAFMHLLTLSSTVDRKSTRLNSSHQIISYAVFCLKKKKEIEQPDFADERLHLVRDFGPRLHQAQVSPE